MNKKARVGVVAVATTGLMALAPLAFANWTAYNWDNKGVNAESQRWSDGDYTQVQFTGCHNGYTSYIADSVDVQVWRVINNWPDDSYDKKTFTACYGAGTSNGEWSEIPTGTAQYYFQIMAIGGKTVGGPTVDVEKVYVDTTKAD
ncbi:hypothetical protein ACFRIC_16045 [Streptomyces sp. NPDC056738]|uniref:hypothetical protein n=1 Tax=Streptomyces sp. NPDC056738 TaxID=3345933 RepID=UPI003691AF02